MHEGDNRLPPPLDLSQLSARSVGKWLVSLKRPDNHWWSKAYYSRRRSALFDLYRDSGAELSNSTNKAIGRCITAINKKVMKQKENLGESLEEGKSPMSFELFQKLCQWFIETGTKAAIFARCFLTLTWNLMCRSNNTVSIRREHIKLTSDSLAIMFAHAKTDKEGVASSHRRHICANPKNWVICPRNALAMCLLTNPSASMSEGPLFPGSSQCWQFSDIMNRTMEEHKAELDEMNIKIEDIGVHSVSLLVQMLICSCVALTLTSAPFSRFARVLPLIAAMAQLMDPILLLSATELGGQWAKSKTSTSNMKLQVTSMLGTQWQGLM